MKLTDEAAERPIIHDKDEKTHQTEQVNNQLSVFGSLEGYFG